ncbi:dihydropteroate synthase [Sanyastnella coralliicola]|uniref:dihydropteroate synthase n=1 Tax=Sanyastnella coralliicola TaxID=3069118 RepID=UPI0027B9C7BB|nr:dihydropteroate synthase [Longitalea sp. SCSIO 12813]
MALTFRVREQLYHFDQPIVMGILNATPDSFHEASRNSSVDQALASAEQMLKDGASIIDIGGQSTRPGAERVSVDQELERVIPLIHAIAERFPEALISIDTFYGKVAREAASAGASIINDVSAWNIDDDMLDAVVDTQLPYILMHMKGTPETMQNSPTYTDVVNDLVKMLSSKLQVLRSKGVSDVFIDPGFGFGKTLEHNYDLLKRLREFDVLRCPILAGVSRKGMIYKPLDIKPEDALSGTIAANTVALMNGADILRVHDVKPAVEAVKIVSFVQH